MSERWARGDTVVLREVWRGQVFSERPMTVLRDDPDLRMLVVEPGSRWQAAVRPDGTLLRTALEADRWDLAERTWEDGPVLSFSRPGRPDAVLAFYDRPSGRLERWYVNLESALRPVADGFEYEDRILDLTVAADRSTWAWKDEDDFAEAVRRGWYTEHEAADIRSSGERALRWLLDGEPPFDLDWSIWDPGLTAQ